jgi:hypothetical protein
MLFEPGAPGSPTRPYQRHARAKRPHSHGLARRARHVIASLTTRRSPTPTGLGSTGYELLSRHQLEQQFIALSTRDQMVRRVVRVNRD